MELYPATLRTFIIATPAHGGPSQVIPPGEEVAITIHPSGAAHDVLAIIDGRLHLGWAPRSGICRTSMLPGVEAIPAAAGDPL